MNFLRRGSYGTCEFQKLWTKLLFLGVYSWFQLLTVFGMQMLLVSLYCRP